MNDALHLLRHCGQHYVIAHTFVIATHTTPLQQHSVIADASLVIAGLTRNPTALSIDNSKKKYLASDDEVFFLLQNVRLHFM
jgi:hypothetical protein